MARHRVARRSEVTPEDADVDMSDVTRVTLPAAVPTNPDGTPTMEGEVSEEQARAIGALTVDSARKNKRNAAKLRDKALGKSVSWNAEEALELIDNLIIPFSQEWGSMIILVSREDPGPRAQFQPVLGANVRNSIDLYNYVASQHGMSGPATYKISFRSSSGAERGTAKLFMPDKTAPSPVQVINPPAPQQQQQQPQQPQYAYPGGGAGGGSGGGQGWPASPGYPWPQQPQPQQQSPQVIVVSPPQQPQQQQAAPPQSPAPVPAPQPIYMPPPPAPASGGFDANRALFEMMQAQNAATMATLKEMVAEMKKPQPPAGFISLPSEQYPVPPGYVRVPGGMMPAPPMAAYPVGPVGVGQVPVAVAAPAAPAQPAQVIVQAPPPAPQPSFGAQIKGTVSMLQEAMSGMKTVQDMFAGFAPQPATVDDEIDDGPQDVPQVPPAMLTQDVGGISMALDRATGKVAWAPTLVGALPKISEFVTKGVDQYRKIVDHQAALTNNAVKQRIELANAVSRAQNPQVPVLPPQPQPPQAPQPPPPQAAPVQAAPPPRPAPVPPPAPKKPTIPVPSGPLWG
jgi:hypothetical protein